MAKFKKALERLQAKPTDFTWDELMSLMEALRYHLRTGGDSGHEFIHQATRAVLFMHEPHPQNVLKAYQVRDAIKFLKQERHIP